MPETNPLHEPTPTKTRVNSPYDYRTGDADGDGHTVTEIDGSRVTWSDGRLLDRLDGWAVVTRLYRTRMVGGEEVTLHHADERVIEEVRTHSGHKGLSYRTCKHDGSPIMSFWIDRGAGRFQAWRHVDGTYCANGSHGPDPVVVATCPDCRGVDSVKVQPEPWGDRAACTECGYEKFYPIGD